MPTCLQLYGQVLIRVVKLRATYANEAACQKEEEGVGGNNHSLLRISNDHIVYWGSDKEQSTSTEESARHGIRGAGNGVLGIINLVHVCSCGGGRRGCKIYFGGVKTGDYNAGSTVSWAPCA